MPSLWRVSKPIDTLKFDISRTGLSSNITVQSREDKVTVREQLGFAVTQDEVAELLRHGRGLLPVHGILVLLVGGARRSTNGVQLKERVVCQQQNEALTHRASGTEDTFDPLALINA